MILLLLSSCYCFSFAFNCARSSNKWSQDTDTDTEDNQWMSERAKERRLFRFWFKFPCDHFNWTLFAIWMTDSDCQWASIDSFIFFASIQCCIVCSLSYRFPYSLSLSLSFDWKTPIALILWLCSFVRLRIKPNWTLSLAHCFNDDVPMKKQIGTTTKAKQKMYSYHPLTRPIN